MFNEASAALVIGLAFGQLARLQGSLRQFSIVMATAEANQRKPIEYQNAMTPRWLVSGFVVVFAGLLYVVAQHFRDDGWQTGVSDLLLFVGGFLISNAMSSLARFPSTEIYARCAMSTLKTREADADSVQSAELHGHFRKLLSTLIYGRDVLKT